MPLTRSLTQPLTSPLARGVGEGGRGLFIPTADAFRADTAATALTTATPDGSGELVHPSIYDAGAGKWNGKRYWMAATPYHSADSTLENPCIYCADSLDGSWDVPAGLTNPIEAFPGGTDYNSDTHLVFPGDGYLYCVWRNVNTGASSESMYYRRSTDGVTWGDKTLVYTALQSARRLVSPAIEWDGTQWVMYAVDTVPSPNTLVRLTSPTLTGTWSAPTTCTITMPSGRDCWHLDAKFRAGRWWLLIQDVPLDGSTGGNLYLCSVASDGLTVNRPASVLVLPVSLWHDLLYRSCLVPTFANGRQAFDLVYSGIRSGGARNLGHTTITSFDTATYAAEPAVAIAGAVSNTPPYLIGDDFTRADASVIGTSSGGEAWTVSAGVPGISSNAAYATTAVNTRAYVEAGAADGYIEANIAHAAAGQTYIVLRLTDANNYWRIGFNVAALVAQKVVAGAVTTSASGGGAYTTLGNPATVRLGVRANGSTITVLVDGKAAFSFTDSFNSTATKVGFQTQNTTSRIDNLFMRSLVNGA